jgi:glutamine amidotransferase
LQRRELVQPVKAYAASGRPMLGICVGMQILLTESEEFGRHEGLGLIPGKVVAIPRTDADRQPHKIPHIGWTALDIPRGRNEASWSGTVFDGLEPGVSAAYFVHSFTAQPDKITNRLADSYYGGQLISAAIVQDNIVGVQFHPEKSGLIGLQILSRFLEFGATPRSHYSDVSLTPDLQISARRASQC